MTEAVAPAVNGSLEHGSTALLPCRVPVKVVPGAKKTRVVREAGGLKVYLTARPVEGQANDALVEVLSDYFQVRRSRIVITKGLKSRNKIITICEI